MTNPKILTTANPDGSFIDHKGHYNPIGKAVYSDGMYIHKAENLRREIKNQFKSKLKVA